MSKTTWKYSLIRSLPVMAGYIVLGTGFGILLAAKGYGVGWAFGMSLFIYAGSMQYVAIDLLSQGASLISAALMTLMVNARHLFYGVSMLGRYLDTGVKKPYLIFALTDETYSLVCSGSVPAGVNERQYYLLVSLLNQCYWVLGSVLGSMIGSLLSFNTAGIEFSMTALFLTVLIDQWRSSQNHISAIVGILASIICLLLFGADHFIIPAMVSIAVLLLLLRRWL